MNQGPQPLLSNASRHHACDVHMGAHVKTKPNISVIKMLSNAKWLQFSTTFYTEFVHNVAHLMERYYNNTKQYYINIILLIEANAVGAILARSQHLVNDTLTSIGYHHGG